MNCLVCEDSGHVCENHPDRAWGGLVAGGCECGGAGAPCPACCSPIPEDGTHSIVEGFTPDRLRCTCFEAGRNPMCPIHGSTAGEIPR